MVEIDDVFKISKEDYCEEYEAHCMSQYKMYIELMDKTSKRRLESNKYFISLNSFLVSLMGIINFSGILVEVKVIWLIFTLVFGAALNLVWISILNSYRNLNDARFHIIHLIEDRLPISLFKQEWEYVQNEQKDKYELLSQVEKNIPLIFTFLYLFLIILGFIQIWLQ